MPALRLPGWAGSRVDSRCDCRTSTLGHVTSLTGTRDDTHFLQMSTPVQPGNSGGPRLDMSGSVVGVVVARLNALPNSAPQNVNFAIHIHGINLLEVKDVTPKLVTSSTGAQRPPSKKFTIQVTAKGFPQRQPLEVPAFWLCHRLKLRILAPNSMYKRHLVQRSTRP
jgi:S1-C subfamily serine protease